MPFMEEIVKGNWVIKIISVPCGNAAVIEENTVTYERKITTFETIFKAWEYLYDKQNILT